MAHAIYFQSAAGPSGRLLASYRGGSTDGVLPHPAVGEGPPMPIRCPACYRGGSADGALPNPAVGEPGSCFSAPWPSFSCLPCYGCRCLLEFEGVFLLKIQNFQISQENAPKRGTLLRMLVMGPGSISQTNTEIDSMCRLCFPCQEYT